MVNFPTDRDIGALAVRQEGHVTRQQLLDLRLTPAEIDYRVKLGRLVPAYRGVYAIGHRRTAPLARLKAAVLAGGPEAVISFSSAVFLWGLAKVLALPIELTVKGDRRIDGLRIHRSTTLTNKDVTTRASALPPPPGPSSTTPRATTTTTSPAPSTTCATAAFCTCQSSPNSCTASPVPAGPTG